MALRSNLFRGDERLEAAAELDSAHVTPGATGDHVRKIQVALIQLDGAGIATDGIYGNGTAAAVLAYKRKRNIVNHAYQSQADNIVGKMTVAAMDEELAQADRKDPTPYPLRPKRTCGNCLAGNQAHGLSIAQSFIQTLQSPSPPSPPSRFAAQPVSANFAQVGDPAPPAGSIFRKLNDTQQNRIKDVYGESVELSTVFLSNKTGIGGLPFTMCLERSDLPFLLVPGVGPDVKAIQIINCGTFEPDDDTLIHEMAHVWQSQHHSNPKQFMKASVDSQGMALATNLLLGFTDKSLRHDQWPSHFPFSAYAYIPNKVFSDYGVEQVANAIELIDQIVRAHVRSIPKGAVDPQNVASLARGKIEDRRKPRARFNPTDPVDLF